MLQIVKDLLFPKRISHLRCPSEEVKILANGSSFHVAAAAADIAKGVIVELVLVFIKLVTQTIIRILKIDTVEGKSSNCQ